MERRGLIAFAIVMLIAFVSVCCIVNRGNRWERERNDISTNK